MRIALGPVGFFIVEGIVMKNDYRLVKERLDVARKTFQLLTAVLTFLTAFVVFINVAFNYLIELRMYART
jgi:hypothetical protein